MWDNPMFAARGNQEPENQWIMPSGEEPTVDALSSHVYDRPEHAATPAFYEKPVRGTAPRIISTRPAGCALLSGDHKRDPDARVPPDERLRFGDVSSQPGLAMASEAYSAYAMLDGTHQLYACHDSGGKCVGSGRAESLPGLRYTTISTESSGYAALAGTVPDHCPTLFSSSSRCIPSILTGDE